MAMRYGHLAETAFQHRDRLSDRHEERQAFPKARVVAVAVLGDREARNRFHAEVRRTRVGCLRIEVLGDIRVVDQGRSLPLGFQPREHRLGDHAPLGDLLYEAADGLFLSGVVDDARAAFPASLE
jgi:hypothetical protein